jgi:hypothetical protein
MGEEIYKPSFSYILINDQPLSSGGVFCKNCAKKFDKKQRKHMVFAIIFLILTLVFIFSAVFYLFW